MRQHKSALSDNAMTEAHSPERRRKPAPKRYAVTLSGAVPYFNNHRNRSSTSANATQPLSDIAFNEPEWCANNSVKVESAQGIRGLEPTYRNEWSRTVGTCPFPHVGETLFSIAFAFNYQLLSLT